ncbi:MAG: hypothetical protein AAFO62_03785, partial [Pseudomonadota bacterium]
TAIPSALAHFGLLAIAFGALTYAYVASDFSVASNPKWASALGIAVNWMRLSRTAIPMSGAPNWKAATATARTSAKCPSSTII